MSNSIPLRYWRVLTGLMLVGTLAALAGCQNGDQADAQAPPFVVQSYSLMNQQAVVVATGDLPTDQVIGIGRIAADVPVKPRNMEFRTRSTGTLLLVRYTVTKAPQITDATVAVTLQDKDGNQLAYMEDPATDPRLSPSTDLGDQPNPFADNDRDVRYGVVRFWLAPQMAQQIHQVVINFTPQTF